MITIRTEDNKFFLSSFINLTENTEAQLDETALTAKDLRYVLVAIESGRLRASEQDVTKIIAAITSKEGGSIDPAILDAKEDKANKVQVVGAGAVDKYPSTKAITTYVATAVAPYALKTDISTLTTKTYVDGLVGAKQDKVSNVPLGSVTTVTSETVPLFTMNNNGTYVLCTPDSWIKIGNVYIPAYSAQTIGIAP